MKRYFLPILIFLISPVFAFAAAGDVVISEIQITGGAGNTENDFIELYNYSNLEINLNGYRLVKRTKSGTTDSNIKSWTTDTFIPANGYYLWANSSYLNLSVEADATTTTTVSNDNGIALRYGPADTGQIFDSIAWGEAENIFKKDFVLLANPSAGQSIQRMADGTWITAYPTPKAQNFNSQNSDSQNNNQPPQDENITANNSASSQNLIADAGPNIAGVVGAEIVFDGSKSINPNGGEMSYSWNFGNGETASGKTAKYVYKYPGRYITVLTVSSGSYQNSDQAEVLIYSAGIFISEFLPNPDGADEENEWIEIANDSDSIADISDFQIGDGSGAVFKIPKNTYVAPRSFLVFARKATKISLNNDEDKVVLYYPNGETVDSVEYDGGAKEGFSAARTSDGRFLWTKNITPGTANMFLSEGGLKSGAASPAQKIVSENNAGEIKSFSVTNFSIVGGQSNGGLISFLPEVSAKTVDGYDESDSAATADGSFENGEKINQSASLIDSLSAKVGSAFGGKNKTAAVFILVPSIILSALIFVFRRKFRR